MNFRSPPRPAFSSNSRTASSTGGNGNRRPSEDAKKSDSDRRPTFPIMNSALAVLLIFVVLGQIFFYTWCRVQCRRLGYEISEEMNSWEQLKEVHNHLQIRAERLKSPERLSHVVESRLSLTMPRAGQKRILPIHEP